MRVFRKVILLCLILAILFPAFTMQDTIINDTSSEINSTTEQNSGNSTDTISNNITTNEDKRILIKNGNRNDFSTIQDIQNERGVSWSIVSYTDNPKSSNETKIYSYNNASEDNLTNKYLVVTKSGSFILLAEVNSQSNNKTVMLDSEVSEGLKGINQRWTLKSYQKPVEEQDKNPKIESILIKYKDTEPSVNKLDKNNVDVMLESKSNHNDNRQSIPIKKVESSKKTVEISVDSYSRFLLDDNSDGEENLIISLEGISSDITRPYSVKIQINLDNGMTDTVTTTVEDE